MANEIFKELKTKIALKYNTYEYWTTGEGKDYAPLKGEVCFCAIESKEQGAQTAPTVLFKVGVDGQTKFSALKWASALAADVYDWAKVAGGNVFTKDGVGNVVSGIEYDATLNAGKGGFKFTTASVATAEGLEDLQKAVDAINRDITNNRTAWNKYEDTRYSFSTDGDKLVVKKTLYTNGVAGTEEAVGTYEFLTETEVKTILNAYYTKSEIDTKLGDYALKSELHAPTTVVEGSGVSVTGTDRNYTVSHADTSNAANLTADGRKYVTGLTFDDYGHVTGYTTGEEVDQDLSHNHDDKYKVIQTAVADPTANGESLTFIDTISQNDQGVITATKKTVNLGDYTKTADIHLIKADAAGTADQVAHKLTAGSKQFDGLADVEITAADFGLESAMHFVGALSEAPDTAKPGDVYLNTATKKEYVYSEGQGWVELGDEGSHALKTVKIEGEGYLVGGGDLSADRKIDITDEVKTKIDNGATAYGWGDHAAEGYAHKVDGAIANNFAALDANGDLIDSGKKATDFEVAGAAADALEEAKSYTDEKTIGIAAGEEGTGSTGGRELLIGNRANGIIDQVNITGNDDVYIESQAAGNISLVGANINFAKGSRFSDGSFKVTINEKPIATEEYVASEISAYNTSKNFGDIITHNVAEFATSAEAGAKALADQNKLAIDAINHAETGILAQAKKDAADKSAVVLSEAQKYADEAVANSEHISEITTTENGGLKVTNKNHIDIDPDVIFVLDCNW